MPVESTETQAPMPTESTEQAKSYRYLRIAMIGLLLALAAAVVYQTIQQDSVLSSVSAYYYTSARAVFAGALIGLGACMIALQGRNDPEDTFLNLGGILAIVVALVPTGRGPDFQTALKACQKRGGALITAQQGSKLHCLTVQALENATRANVENNMAALLIVGGLALILAGVILFKGRTAKRGTTERRWVLAAFFVAVLLWLGDLAALAASVAWLADNGHYIAAGGLLLCILAVAVANALDRKAPAVAVANALRRQQGPAVAVVNAPGRQQRPSVRGALKSPRAHRYTWIAIAMLAVAVVLIPLWLTGLLMAIVLGLTSAPALASTATPAAAATAARRAGNPLQAMLDKIVAAGVPGAIMLEQRGRPRSRSLSGSVYTLPGPRNARPELTDTPAIARLPAAWGLIRHDSCQRWIAPREATLWPRKRTAGPQYRSTCASNLPRQH